MVQHQAAVQCSAVQSTKQTTHCAIKHMDKLYGLMSLLSVHTRANIHEGWEEVAPWAPREIRLPQSANRHKSGEQLSQQQPDTSGTEYKPGGHTVVCAHAKTKKDKKQILHFFGTSLKSYIIQRLIIHSLAQ